MAAPQVFIDGQGYMSTQVGPASSYAFDALIQADGKIVLAGTATGYPRIVYSHYGIYTQMDGAKFALVRYNENGTLDLGFGINGVVTTSLSGEGGIAKAVTIDRSGNLYIIGNGTYFGGWGSVSAVIKYLPNGTLDQSFGDKGILYSVTLEARKSGPQDLVNGNDIIVSSDGSILTTSISSSGVVLQKINASETVGNSIEWNGPTSVPNLANPLDSKIYIQSDGKILVGGNGDPGGNAFQFIARYLSDGTLDSTFGSSGVTVKRVSGGQIDSIGVQSNGTILIDNIASHAILRFDSNGKYLSNINIAPTARCFTILKDDSVLVAGCAYNSPNYATWLYSPTGELLKYSPLLIRGSPYDISLLPDGKILLSGSYSPTTGWGGFGLIRLNSDLSLDTTFDLLPSLTTSSPTNNSIDIKINADIVLTFSENVQLGPASIALKTDAGLVIETYVANTSPYLKISGNTLKVNPSVNLNYGTKYTLEFAEDSVRDLAGNSYIAQSEYNFTTEAAPDTAPPSVVALSPTDESTGLSTTITMELRFNEDIYRGIGDITLKTIKGVIVEIYDAARSNNLSISGNILTIIPSVALNYSANYEMEFSEGCLTDLAGNKFTGMTGYRFSTNFSPVATQLNASLDEDITFTDKLAGTDIDGNTLTFAKETDPSHGTVTVNATTGAYTYTPAANYNGSDSFTFKVNDGTVDSVAATVSLTVNAVNDAPIQNVSMADVRVTENKSLTLLLPDSMFVDTDDILLSYSASLAGEESLPSWLQFNAISRVFSINPKEDVVGTTAQNFVVEVAATDSGGLRTTSSFNLLVRPLGSGYDIQADVVFWKNNSSGEKPKLAGVEISKGSEKGTSSDQTGVTLLSVEDNDGKDDGFMTLAPQASSPDNAKSAITLTDVLAALKVYLGKSLPDSYSSPLNYIAADFDGNGTVNLTDVLSLLKYYLGKSTTSAPAWAFVDAADLSSDGKSFAGANIQSISKTDATPHAIDQSFDSGHESIQIIGILRGDVDGSWSP